METWSVPSHEVVPKMKSIQISVWTFLQLDYQLTLYMFYVNINDFIVKPGYKQDQHQVRV